MVYSRIRAKSCAILTAFLCLVLLWFSHVFYQHGGLIEVHRHFAQQVNNGAYLAVLHPGIYWLGSLLSHITSLPIDQSLDYLLSIHVALTLCAIIWALKLLYVNDADPYALLLCAIAVMIEAPIGIPLLNPVVYNFPLANRTAFLLRNATHTAVLPYAIAAFGLLGSLLQSKISTGSFNKKPAITAGILLCISALMKPSFAVTIIPAIVLYMTFSKQFSWKERGKILSILAPTALLILVQFYIGFVSNPETSRVIHLRFDPWTVWVNNNQYPLLSLMLAIVFPAFILAYRRNKVTVPTIVAWLNLYISIIPYILFNEVPGISTSWDRDFEWSYLHARQILFLCSVVEWWRWMQSEPTQSPGFPKTLNATHIAGLLLMAQAMFGYVRLLIIDTIQL